MVTQITALRPAKRVRTHRAHRAVLAAIVLTEVRMPRTYLSTLFRISSRSIGRAQQLLAGDPAALQAVLRGAVTLTEAAKTQPWPTASGQTGGARGFRLGDLSAFDPIGVREG
jgi:hypothetical protein